MSQKKKKEYGSILNFYKRLIAFYKSEEYNEILTYGDFRPMYEKEDHIFHIAGLMDVRNWY